MSKFRTAALSAVAVLGFAALAGSQVPAKPDADRGIRGRVGAERGDFGRGQGGGRMMAQLNLTDAQKTRIKAIHEKYQPQFKTLHDQARTQFKGLRDSQQKRDTSAAARQRFQQQREQFRQRVTTLRQQEQNEIRSILTADQRAKWDEAQKERAARFEGRRDKMKGRHGPRSKA